MTNNKPVNRPMSTSRSEELFDAILKAAAKTAFYDEMEQMLDDLDKMDDIKPSAELDRKVRNMIARESRVHRRKRLFQTFTKVAAVFAVVVTVSAIALMSVEASRNFIINFLIGIQDDHVVIEFGPDGRPIGGQQGNVGELNGLEVVGIVFGYVPEGFEVVDYQLVGVMSIVIFSDGNEGQIVVRHQMAQSLSAFIDNEAREFSSIYLSDGREGLFFEAVGYGYQSTIIWQCGSDIFMIHANLEPSSSLRMADNITTK